VSTRAPTPAPSADRNVDFGTPSLRFRTTSASFRIQHRTLLVCTVLAVLALAVAVVSLGTGSYPLSPGQVVEALLGRGEAFTRTIVLEWRLPRVLLALIFGMVLAASGALFQSLTRNPLGSPDVIGFDSGAYTAVLLVMLAHVGSDDFYGRAAAALAGGAATALLVYLLAYRRGLHGFRLIIVGISVSAVLGSIDAYLLVKANIQDAMAAAVWGTGSLAGVGWPQVLPAGTASLVFLLAAAAVVRPLSLLELGDDAASALGVRPQRTRAAVMLVGVALSASVTATAGPIGFIALAAPQLSRRLTGAAGPQPFTAAVMGALLLVSSDWVAQHAFAVQVPVGVVTVSIGGLYLLWLLYREARTI
jgi:iron complex transport system permease protein